MPDVDVTAALSPELSALLERHAALPGVEVHAPRVPTARLSVAEILAAAADLIPHIEVPELAVLAELSPRRPCVDGVAWLDFQQVTFYRSGDGPFASVGTFSSNPEFPPFVRLTLAEAPTGNGVLVTCRASAISSGPSYPGYYRVEGPGIANQYENTGHPTTFPFVVPPGGTGPVEIKIHTDPDRIRLWGLSDCVINQI